MGRLVKSRGDGVNATLGYSTVVFLVVYVQESPLSPLTPNVPFVGRIKEFVILSLLELGLRERCVKPHWLICLLNRL